MFDLREDIVAFYPENSHFESAISSPFSGEDILSAIIYSGDINHQAILALYTSKEKALEEIVPTRGC